MYAASLLSGSAAVWYRTLEQRLNVNNMTYPEFRNAVIREYIDLNLMSKARAKLRALK